MKEMVGAGDDDDRQFERFRPGQYVCQRNGGIGGAMNDQRVFRDRTRGVLTGSLNVAGCRADEDQSLCRLSGFGQRLRDTRLHIGAERESRQHDGQLAEDSPSLVKDYKVSDDGLTYTFTLQPGVTFHSGDPLTSADVKWSIERVTSADSKSSRKNSLKPIAAIETPGLAARLEDPERRRKILGNYVLRRLGQPTDAAKAILFLASSASSWVTGQTYAVNGGYAFSA